MKLQHSLGAGVGLAQRAWAWRKEGLAQARCARGLLTGLQLGEARLQYGQGSVDAAEGLGVDRAL